MFSFFMMIYAQQNVVLIMKNVERSVKDYVQILKARVKLICVGFVKKSLIEPKRILNPTL